MSSAMKDARWQLAYTTLTKAGIAYDELTYLEFQTVLDACQVVLNHTALGKIQDLSDEWNRGA